VVSIDSRAPSRPPMPSWWLWAMAHGKEDRMESVHKTTEEILAGIRDPELRQAAANLKRAMNNNPRDVPGDVSEPKTAKIIQLPVWGEFVRGTPNSLLRGSLFAAIQSKDRRYMNREILAAQDGIEIRFTGMQLNQTDLDVWEQAVHWARPHPLGHVCYFTAYGFLRALGRRTGGYEHNQLKEELARLIGGAIEITHRRMTYAGNLLEYWRDEDNEHYLMRLNSKILALWTAGWTAIDRKQRVKLRRKPLSLWLHGFYASHADPHPMKVETYKRLCGSHNNNIYCFTQRLAKAHEDLVEVGAIEDFDIIDGIVSTDNVPSQSQQRHLARAKNWHGVRDRKARG